MSCLNGGMNIFDLDSVLTFDSEKVIAGSYNRLKEAALSGKPIYIQKLSGDSDAIGGVVSSRFRRVQNEVVLSGIFANSAATLQVYKWVISSNDNVTFTASAL